MLATSRVPLVVAGEATFEVAGLPVPDPDAGSASTVAAADAARLFEVRARQVAADFRIGDDNASAVAEICRRLDGIPLAIELAAARVRVLAPGQIAAGLSDRFGLLTGGVRGAPARQRTLEASLDWSYDLLDDAQRLALARLSVFAGSFELDAAEAVVGGDGIDRDDVLDLVAGLVEQSLLQVVERQGRARYRLLETIRVYARQRLSELDDPDRVRGRHLEFHVGLAGRAHVGLTGGQPEPWVARLAADLDDLRAAMDWAAEAGDLRALVDLTEPIVRFWFERGLSREVHRRLHDAAEVPGAPDDERVRGLIAAAALALAGCEPASFHRSASQAVAAARAADVGGALAVALGQRALSGVLSGLSTSEQVDADVEQAVQRAQRCEDAVDPRPRPAVRWGGTALQPLDRRRVPPVPAGRGGVRGQRPRLPSAGRPRGPCGVVGVVRAARPDTPTRSPCRRAQPAGRTSRVGGGRADRAWSRCRPAGRSRPSAGLALRGAGGAAATSPGGISLRDVGASLAGPVGLRIRRPGNCSGHGGGDRADRPWWRQPLGRGDRRVAAGHGRTKPGAPRRRASTPGGQPRTVDRPTAPPDAGSVVARPRGAGQGGRGPRRGVGAGP